MRGLRARIAAVAALVALAVVGLLGAYGYGHDYQLHRGFTALAQLPRAGTGRLLTVQFYSPALHRRADYMVYLPPGYSQGRRYPVYYLLHGMPGQPKVFVDIANMDVRLDNQLSLGRAGPMILVYPDGRIGGSVFSDSEWANTSAGDFESYVLDVVHDVDQRFSTLPHRQDRVIGGFSAGAYGALNIALHHLGEFSNVQSWSGYFNQTRTGVFARAGQASLAYNSPLTYVSRLGRSPLPYPLRVYMFVGRDDEVSSQQQAMAQALRRAGAQVQQQTFPGGHDWSVWYPRLNQVLDLAWGEIRRPAVRVISAAPVPVAAATSPSPHRLRHTHSELRLLAALLLALISGALINLGFVLQQRGHLNALQRGHETLLDGFRDRSWLVGQGVGWIGFLGQIVAVAMAPLTLVQAFCAGSLALSVPLAARLGGQRVSRDQLAFIAVIAVCLASLPVGFAPGHNHLHAGLLIAAALLAMLASAELGPLATTAGRAIAAGALYGAADAAIKADAVVVHVHGAAGLLSGWPVLAGLCTLGGFMCFQAALRGGDAVQPLTLMNALTAVTAVALGLLAFGEPLGTTPIARAAHVFAIAVVLACVRPLARTQQRLVHALGAEGAGPEGPAPAPARERRTALGVAASSLLAAPVLIGGCLIATGLLYMLRSAGWPSLGPAIADSLPLLQLAGFAGQPLLSVLLAGLGAGLVVGAALSWVARRQRLFFVAIFGTALMLIASDASYALARNLRFDQVLLNRAPGLGAWLIGTLMALGAAVTRHRPVSHTVKLRARTISLPIGRPAALEGPLVVAPLLALGITVAVLAAFILPSNHARAKDRDSRVLAPAGPRPGGLATVEFYSRALGRKADYLVYLPSEYRRSHRLPVFYMLHGLPGRPLAFTVDAGVETKLEDLIRRHQIRPMILVFPDGRIDGRTHTDSEWANTPSGHYDSYVVDVVRDVDHRFATLRNRRDRAIAGLSAGAYGAINVALHHVALFGSVQVWSGYFRQTPTGVFTAATPRTVAYNSPMDYVLRLRPVLRKYRLDAFLYSGTDDRERNQTPTMTALLVAEGADAHYAIYRGGHSWKLWAPRVDDMLIRASRQFSTARRS